MLARISLRLNYKTLTKSYNVSESILSHRSLHLTCKVRDTAVKNSCLLRLSRQKPFYGAAFVRYASTDDKKIPDDVLPSIPEPPSPPAPEAMDLIQAAGEHTLTSLGLGGYTPPGLIQTSLEWLHVDCGLPWWGAIVVGTICVRTLLLPLVIRAQRNTARMTNHMPQIQHIQNKMSDARQCGDDFEAARYAQELTVFMKEKKLSPFSTMITPLVQAPFFISFFMALRGMANAPVESMREGGLWWFTDLTIPDPYYLLPVITSATLWVTIKVGVDGGKIAMMSRSPMYKYVIHLIPVFVFPFTMNFPGAVLCYWVSTNFISLLQVSILKIPAIRKYCKIEALIKQEVQSAGKNKGFVKGFKESWSNMKLAREVSDRSHVDHLEFERAGKGPVPKTFKYDPTRQTPPTTQIFTKKQN